MSLLERLLDAVRRLFGGTPAPAPTPAPTPITREKKEPDNYPGDDDYTRLLQEIYHGRGGQGGVSHDKIALSLYPHPNRPDKSWTRTEIIRILLDRYDDPIPGAPQDGSGGPHSCKSWLFGTNFTEAACLASLTNPTGYDDASGWRRWAGAHSGTWYADGGKRFKDDAVWNAPREEGMHPPGSAPPAGSPYDFQPVEFKDQAGATERRGWNQSHKDVEYLWGWDPKDEGQENGRNGAHLGFRHVEDGAEAIFWFTTRECFFEAIKEVDGLRHRISVGLWGRGLWTVN